MEGLNGFIVQFLHDTTQIPGFGKLFESSATIDYTPTTTNALLTEFFFKPNFFFLSSAGRFKRKATWERVGRRRKLWQFHVWSNSHLVVERYGISLDFQNCPSKIIFRLSFKNGFFPSGSHQCDGSLASQSYFSFAHNVSVESRDARPNPKFSNSIHILYCLSICQFKNQDSLC